MTRVVSQLNNPVAGFDGTVKLPYLTYADNTVVRMVGHHVIHEHAFADPSITSSQRR